MKKIGLLSDTHGHWDDKFNKYFADCDEVWHAGDIGSMALAEKFEELKPFRAVYGNIDDYKTRLAYPEILNFEIENVKIMMTHIGGYPGRYEPSIISKLKAGRPKLFISGHSHILKVMYDEKFGLLHMNPGAAGLYGFHKVRTLLRFVVDDGNIRDLEVIELEKRF
ncbi:MAG TPA: metallophosphoesterase family protein [Fermentimonas sp.]|nr:metallophosphoesterase family protein [Fermentimonas sp.]